MNTETMDSDILYCFAALNDSCTKTSRAVTTKTLLYTVFTLSILLTVLGNLSIIISISHFKQLHSPTNFLLLSLATDDLLVGIIVMPFSMIRSVESCWYFGDDFCILLNCFDMSLTTASIYHLIFIAVDRYYAICKPLLYPVKITNHVALLFALISWVAPLAYAFSFLYVKSGFDDRIATKKCSGNCTVLLNPPWATVDCVISLIFPCTLMVSMYVKVFQAARKHAQVICTDHKVTGHRNKMNQNKGGKALRTLAIVMSMFVLCWFPAFGDYILESHIHFYSPPELYNILMWLGYFNSAMNPIIYAFFFRWFQKALKLVLQCKICTADSSLYNLFQQSSEEEYA
ncbi:trace amine-associated receptor 4-like [Protopterus annectens]|uniref:trace amine-associated receptor 4-like n=1 Tax=Protopterus annectens TaxID=7888 RepID=UPI001CFC184E|nr:trace amine-associated receptor 4-like [Protopterus annectens]